MDNSFNYFRKMWHITGIIVPVAYYLDLFDHFLGFDITTRIFISRVLIVDIVIVLIVDFLRLNNESFSRFFWKYAGSLMKLEEKNKFNATIPYLLSNLFVIYFFPPEISILAILFLIIGDPFAAYVGIFYGRKKLYNGKSLEGIIAFFISSFIVGFTAIWLIVNDRPFLGVAESVFDPAVLFILLTGTLSAAISEFFSKNEFNGLIDDNFNIPFVSSIVMGVAAVMFLGVGTETIFLLQ